jgi:hypothetical protein
MKGATRHVGLGQGADIDVSTRHDALEWGDDALLGLLLT